MIDFGAIIKSLAGAIDRYGSKFVVAGGAIAALYHLAIKEALTGIHAGIGIVVIAIAFFIFRSKQESNGGVTSTLEVTEEERS